MNETIRNGRYEQLGLLMWSVALLTSISAGLHHLNPLTNSPNPDQSPREPLPFAHMTELKEQMGAWRDTWPGAALFDYDSDGDLDIYLTNGQGFPNGLLQNDGRGHFVNVASQAGVAHQGGTGAVSADIDNDGDHDLFVAGVDRNALYLNNGDGTFLEIAKDAGVSGQERGEPLSRFATSSAFCDFDLDGWIDLYVAYAEYPGVMARSALFRNNKDLTFSDIADEAGVAEAVTRSAANAVQNSIWAVACFDYDRDNDPDLMLAVDFASVTLFRNDLMETGALRFSNVTLEAGLGITGNWMGLAIADYDRDSKLDVFVTNWGTSPPYFQSEIPPVEMLHHALYRNNGDGTFTDSAVKAGVAHWEIGWGAVSLDWDNDGDMDLYYAGNFGIVDPRGIAFSIFDNPGHLFLNRGDGIFLEVSAQLGLFNRDEQGNNLDARGVAVGDLDGNGFFDIVVANAAKLDPVGQITPGIPSFFRNPANDNHWLKIKLVGRQSNRSAIGARVAITLDSQIQVQEVQSGSSFLSQNSLELGLGLGSHSRVEQIAITWPSGRSQLFFGIGVDQTLVVTEPE